MIKKILIANRGEIALLGNILLPLDFFNQNLSRSEKTKSLFTVINVLFTSVL